jgi:hypothetical protein
MAKRLLVSGRGKASFATRPHHFVPSLEERSF